jgi:hypothetical protein
MSNKVKIRTCPYSKVDFEPKRSNQKFASPQCRISHNNEINNSLRRKLNEINKLLLKNFKILDSLLGPNKEVAVNKFFLRGAGFSFTTFTHVGQRGDEFVYGVYDISFQKHNQDEYLIYRTND